MKGKVRDDQPLNWKKKWETKQARPTGIIACLWIYQIRFGSSEVQNAQIDD